MKRHIVRFLQRLVCPTDLHHEWRLDARWDSAARTWTTDGWACRVCLLTEDAL